jgi:uncharacterized membrane protein
MKLINNINDNSSIINPVSLIGAIAGIILLTFGNPFWVYGLSIMAAAILVRFSMVFIKYAAQQDTTEKTNQHVTASERESSKDRINKISKYLSSKTVHTDLLRAAMKDKWKNDAAIREVLKERGVRGLIIETPEEIDADEKERFIQTLLKSEEQFRAVLELLEKDPEIVRKYLDVIERSKLKE